MSDCEHQSGPSNTTSVEPFRIEEERLRGRGVVLFALYGEVDLHGAPELRDRLTAATDEDTDLVVIDLSRVGFMDSMALGVLLSAQKRLSSRGGQLRIVLPRETDLYRIFELTMLDRVFTLDASRREALADVMDPWG